ncbi:MAG: hypothetical protein MI921_21850, partial [Cytophagales bacterium]|nr:hypothetical protein [Cytophagales bacterium]
MHEADIKRLIPENVKTMSLTLTKALFIKILLFLLIAVVPIIWTNKTLDSNNNLQFALLAFILLLIWIVAAKAKQALVIRNPKVRIFLLLYMVYIGYSCVSFFVSNNSPDAFYFLLKSILFFLIVVSILVLDDIPDIFEATSRAAILLILFATIPAFYQLCVLIGERDLIIPLST